MNRKTNWLKMVNRIPFFFRRPKNETLKHRLARLFNHICLSLFLKAQYDANRIGRFCNSNYSVTSFRLHNFSKITEMEWCQSIFNFIFLPSAFELHCFQYFLNFYSTNNTLHTSPKHMIPFEKRNAPKVNSNIMR